MASPRKKNSLLQITARDQLQEASTANGLRAWTGLNDYRGFERNGGEVLHVKEVLTLQFVVFQTAAGVRTVCLDLDAQNSAPHICGRKPQACVPFVEGPFNGDR